MVPQGSTASGPFDIGSQATRTLYTVGHLLTIVGKELKDQILSWTADFLTEHREYIASAPRLSCDRFCNSSVKKVMASSLSMDEGIITGENNDDTREY